MGELRIVSHSSTPFVDRREAGRLLARQMAEFISLDVVVLGIPRGGVVVAGEIARELAADLDVVLAHKLVTPGQAELAMGAVAEDGRLFLNREVIGEAGITARYIEEEKARQLVEMQRRTEIIRRVRPRVSLAGRTVIVSDDGVATGATTQAALGVVRLEKPAQLMLALPVGPADTVAHLAGDADLTVCLRTPPFFSAVGQFYQHFYPVTDDEMLRILQEERQRELEGPRTVMKRRGG